MRYPLFRGAEYVAAVLFTAGAVFVRWLLDSLLTEHLPLVTIYPAVALAIWLGGYRPAIVVVVLGYLACDYLFIETRGKIGPEKDVDKFGLVAYLLFCTIITVFGERFRRVIGRMEDDQSRLQQADEFHRAIANLSADFAWSARVEPDGTIVTEDVTDGFARVLGYTPDELLARGGWHVLVHPDDTVILEKSVQQALTGEAIWGEVRQVARDGRVVWIRYAIQPVLDETGRVVRLYGGSSDVTPQRHAEEVVRAQEAQLESITENTSVLLVRIGRDLRYTFANQACAEFFDRPREAIVGRHLTEVMGQEAFEAIRPYVEEVLRGEIVEFETTIPYADLGPRFMRAKYVPDIGHGGAVTGWFATVTDITERRRTEERLRRNQETFFALIENAPFGVYVVDADFRLRQVSAGSRKVFGNIHPLIGRDFAEVLRVIWPEPFATEVVGRFRHTLATGEPYHSADTTERRHDVPETESYDWKIERITLPDGQYGVVCYFYDITERKRAEESLRSADRRKSEFLAVLAHELRNPLAPLRNALQLLRMTSGPVPRPFEMMERQVAQMVRLVDDLLDVSRIDRGKVELRRTRVTLAAVVSDAAETARPLCEKMGHELTVALPREPVWVDADPARLVQVVGNLLQNACKFTERGGHITLAAAEEDGQAIIRVRDTGIGITADQLPRIFEMFAQVDASQHRSQGGLGIGLTLVRQLVEMHGGTVEARSDGPGRGSEFVVRLPLAHPESDTHLPPASGEAAPAVVRYRVLVADDNADAAASLAELLEVMGHEVHTACDGEQAVEEVASFRPDVVLLDIGMPKLDGYQACRRIRELSWGRSIVVVALTGWGQDDDRRRSVEAGFDHHLVKPLDPAALERLLTNLPTHAA